ncbi:MAG: Uncharacterised protein [Cryomorphaceae bacterium]|nr:MAG: Uncharacterised protein [Cryomorphaceae bacterium]
MILVALHVVDVGAREQVVFAFLIVPESSDDFHARRGDRV